MQNWSGRQGVSRRRTLAGDRAAIHQWCNWFQDTLNNARPKRCDLKPLSSAQVPVLAIIGKSDFFQHGPKMATQFRDQLRAARVELVEDANHMVMNDQPESVEKLLSDFLTVTPQGWHSRDDARRAL
jgi:pimeloyl-ACP methyl ester carboxylesterase